MTMKKKVIAMVLGTTMTLVAAGAAFAAVTSEQADAIAKFHQERINQKAAVIQQWVDNGKITEDQKKQILDRMEANFKARQEAGFEGCAAIQADGTFKPGAGMGMGAMHGKGMGGRMGFGGGMGMHGVGWGLNK